MGIKTLDHLKDPEQKKKLNSLKIYKDFYHFGEILKEDVNENIGKITIKIDEKINVRNNPILENIKKIKNVDKRVVFNCKENPNDVEEEDDVYALIKYPHDNLIIKLLKYAKIKINTDKKTYDVNFFNYNVVDDKDIIENYDEKYSVNYIENNIENYKQNAKIYYENDDGEINEIDYEKQSQYTFKTDDDDKIMK